MKTMKMTELKRVETLKSLNTDDLSRIIYGLELAVADLSTESSYLDNIGREEASAVLDETIDEYEVTIRKIMNLIKN